MSSKQWRWIPNALTFLRMVLIVPFAGALLEGNYRLSLVIFFVAALTDAFDGFLARHFNWRSRLGAVADPLADKVRVDFKDRAWLHLRSLEGNVLHDALDDGVQPARANVLDGRVDFIRNARNGLYGILGETQIDALGREKELLLAQEVQLRFRQDFVHIALGKGLQLHTNGQSAL